jgi:hypothetical protein
VVKLTTSNDKTAYRQEVKALAVWRQENSIFINVNKMQELIVDLRRQQRDHTPIHIDRSAVERLKSFKFFCVHIIDNLKWSTHTDSVVKKVQQCLFNLKRLKKLAWPLRPL